MASNHEKYNKIKHTENSLPNMDLTISEGAKRKNNYKWVETMLDYYDAVCIKSPLEQERHDENFELHRGSWSTLDKHESNVDITFEGEEYGISGLKIRHFPIINRVTMNILGDIIKNPLIPMVRDYSASSKNYRERHKQELAKQILQERFVKPKEQQIRAQAYQNIGVENPNELNPEQQQQVEQQIGQALQSQLPDEVINAVESQLSPEEIIFQKFLEFVIKDEDVEQKFFLGAENAVVVAEEYYRVGVINSRPTLETLNPKYVSYFGSEHTEFVENMTAAKYEQYLTPQDIIQKYGEHLMKKDIKELENLFADFGTAGTQTNRDWESLELTEQISRNPELQDYVGNPKTVEGQDKLKFLYSILASRGHTRNKNQQNWGIREAYICFKWTRWAKYVTRKVNGKLVNLWKADHYTMDKSKGDVKVERKQIPQVYHGVTLGEYGSGIKIMVEPVPWQYNSLKDPFRVKLPIHGCKINTHMNNTENISHVDLGKPFQFEYNSLRRDWEKYRRTNLGKVLMGFASMIPDDMDIGSFYSVMDNLKIAFINNKFEGINQSDTSLIKDIDLSNRTDMLGVLQDMEVVKREMYEAMHFNQAKLGQQGQYTTATGIQHNIQAANTQLAKFHNRRRQIKERVLEYLLNATIAAYADNENKKTQILDDQSIAYLDANYEFLSTREFSLFVVDDFRESQKLEIVRQQVQAFIQNGANMQEVIALIRADSIAEIEKLAEKIDRRRQKEVQAQREHEMAVLDKQQKTEFDAMKFKQAHDKLMQERKLEVDLARTDLNSKQMLFGNDVDRNQIPDSLQKAIVEAAKEDERQKRELQHEKEENERDRDLERWKTAQKETV